MYLRSYTKNRSRRKEKKGKKKIRKKDDRRQNGTNYDTSVRVPRFSFAFDRGRTVARPSVRASSKREKAEIGDSGGLGRRTTNNRMKSSERVCRIRRYLNVIPERRRDASQRPLFPARAPIPLIPGQPITIVTATTATETEGKTSSNLG